MDIQNMFIILYSIIALETLIIVFLYIKTPVFTFLASAFTNKDIVYLVGKDKRAEFKLVKKQFGSAVVKGEGIFNLTENSATLEKKTKSAIYFAFKDFAATLDLTYPAILQELKDAGYKINTIDDIQNLIGKIKKELIEPVKIGIKPYTTYNIHNLENMFPLNLDPTFIDAQVQGELNKYNKLIKGTNMVLQGLAILVVISAVAVFILNKAFKGQISTAECEAIASAGAKAVRTTVINATALVN